MNTTKLETVTTVIQTVLVIMGALFIFSIVIAHVNYEPSKPMRLEDMPKDIWPS